MTQQTTPDNSTELPPDYPHTFTSEIRLKDDLVVHLRPILPEDAARLQQMFARLSPESIYLRFLETLKELSFEHAEDLATVDYHHRMAIVAEVQEGGEKSIIGVARYALIGPQRPGVAECAIAVIDDYQRRGLASILMNRLVDYARGQDVNAFTGTVHMTNAPIMRFVRKSGFSTERVMVEPGTWEIIVHLR